MGFEGVSNTGKCREIGVEAICGLGTVGSGGGAIYSITQE